jgi:AcrR family transcriptional regulator
MNERAYTRLDVDTRRLRLLEPARTCSPATATTSSSMAAIARAAGISKALLYHYFPSKQAYFVATLQQGAAELAERVRRRGAAGGAARRLPRLGRGPRRRLPEARPQRHERAEVREVIEGVRAVTAQRILAGLPARRRGAPRAVRAWLWFMDGAILDWLEHRDLDRAQLRALLLRTL